MEQFPIPAIAPHVPLVSTSTQFKDKPLFNDIMTHCKPMEQFPLRRIEPDTLTYLFIYCCFNKHYFIF